MQVVAVVHRHVQRDLGVEGEGAEEFLQHVEVELEPDLGLLRLALDASLPAFRLAAHARESPCPAALVAIRTSAAAPCPARPSTRVKARRCGSAAWSPVAAYSMTLVRVTKS